MPRKAPTEIVEQRITFGTYERQFVTEVKNDIEKSVKVAAVTTVAVPAILGASIVGGLGLLGYGIYRGMDAFGSLSDVVETFGCAVRNYTRATIPLAKYFVKECVDSNFTPQTPYNPDAPPVSEYGGGSPRGGGNSDFIPPYGENARDREPTTRGQ